MVVILDISERKIMEDKLRAEQERMQSIMNAIPGGFCIFKVDDTGIHRTYLSKSAAFTLGYKLGEITSVDMIKGLGRVYPDDLPIINQAIAAAVKTETPFNHDHRMIAWDGTIKWVNLTANPIRVDGILYYYGVYSDIDERKAAMERISQSEEEFRLIAEQSDRNYYRYIVKTHLLITTKNADNTSANNQVSMQTPEQFVESGFVAQETENDWLTMFADIDDGIPSGHRELAMNHFDGSVHWYDTRFTTIYGTDGKPISAIISYEDITEQKKESKKLRTKAEFDPLTGVLNRATFEEKVNALLSASGQEITCALLMMDIDNFKLVNDTFGHGAGDQTLIDTASDIRSLIRAGDLVGRLGGDEFVAFLKDIPNASIAEKKALMICKKLRKNYNTEVELSASVGIAVSPGDGKSFAELYKKADSALYHVKNNGKNNYAIYRDTMTDEHPVTRIDCMVECAKKKSSPQHRMLIIDDSELEKTIMANLFAEEYIIDTAETGSEAISHLRRYGSVISIVMLDLMMPGMDGFDVLRKMQENEILSHIPVIVVSGNDNIDTCMQAIRSGASDYITKPYAPDVIRVRVAAAIHKVENEKLRAQNSMLAYQSSENEKLKALLEEHGIETN